MPRVTLSDEIIPTLEPPSLIGTDGKKGGRIIYWDDSLPRFGIEVTGGGKKTYLALVGPDKHERRINLGSAIYIPYTTAKAQAQQLLGRTQYARAKSSVASPTTIKARTGFTISAVFIARINEELLAAYDQGYRDALAGRQPPKTETSSLPVAENKASYVSIRREGGRERLYYQRYVPIDIQPILGKRLFKRSISSKLSSAEQAKLVEFHTQTDTELFATLRDEHGLSHPETTADEIIAKLEARKSRYVPAPPKPKTMARRKIAIQAMAPQIAEALPKLYADHPDGIPTKALAAKLGTFKWVRETLQEMHNQGQLQWVYVNAGGYDSKYVFPPGASAPPPRLTASQEKAMIWLRSQPQPIRGTYGQIAASAGVPAGAIYKCISQLQRAGYIEVATDFDTGTLAISVTDMHGSEPDQPPIENQRYVINMVRK